jgi:hypothetical protein
MSLTFRSSSPEAKIFIDRQPDGRQRVARATRESGARQWQLSVEHPDGQRWNGSFNGERSEVVLALGQMLAKTENEFAQAKARGDKPSAPTRDLNVRVDANGNDIGARIDGHLKG